MSDVSLETDVQVVAVGDVLRDARIAANWTIAEVANKLNLTVNAVESIETSRFERLPGITFARGYIRSYAKILGLDANQLVKQFDQTVGSNTIDNSVHTIDRVGEARRVSRGMLQFSAFVVFLIAVGAAYYAWQTFNTLKPQEDSQSAVFDRVEVERADGSVHVQTMDELEDQAVAIALEPGTAISTQLAALAPQTSEDEQAPEQIEQAAASGDTDLQLEPGMGVAQLSFENESWVRVQDADGTEINSGLKRAGEQFSVTGKAPLSIHLGYAKGVSIIYNGEPVDFSASIKGETARITLDQ